MNLNSKYGRKIGFLNLYQSYFFNLFGRYKKYKDINWSKVHRLVFICHGNICRSAYGEAFAQTHGLNTVSAGLGAEKDKLANPEAIEMAHKFNIDMTSHRTTPILSLKRHKGDLFLCMEPSQAQQVSEFISQDADQQVTILGLWADEPRPYLQDPYGLTKEYWSTCFSVINSAVNNISQHLNTSLKEHSFDPGKE